MASALSSLANATVRLTVPVDGTVTDPETGNVVPATMTQTYQLFVRAAGPALQELPGINADTTTYEGYCLEPQALDPKILEGTFGTLNFSGQGEFECKVLQIRHAYGSEGLLGRTLQGVLGDRIRVARLRAL